MEQTTIISAEEKPIRANGFIKTFGILGIISYVCFFVIGIVLAYYSFLLGLLGGIFYEAFSGKDAGISVDLLMTLPFANVAIFFALSLVGLILLLRMRFTGFYIFVITQLIGIVLTIYLISIFEAFWLFGALFLAMFIFFPAMFATHVGKYR
jgi:hypothetical protein